MVRFAKQLVFISIPILVMIAFIPLIENDILLSAIYVSILLATLKLSGDKKELLFFVLGFALLALSEMFFVATGVETFHRDALFMNIPIWLPILWGYAFIMIRRLIVALDVYLAR